MLASGVHVLHYGQMTLFAMNALVACEEEEWSFKNVYNTHKRN